MDIKFKIGLAVIVTALLTYYLTREFGTYNVIGTHSDTTSTERISYNYTQNTFTAAQIGKIKRVLTDSLNAIYKSKLRQVYAGPVQVSEGDLPRPVADLPEYVYSSESDTSFAAKDSLGVIDSLKIIASFISTEPIPKKSIHTIAIESFTRHKEAIKETTITNTTVVEKKKSIFDLIKIKPNVSAGYGLFKNKFDVYVGLGVEVDL